MPPQQTQIPGDNGDSAKTPLRVCCYGSSNKNTRQEYTREAYTLGQILGRRGHTCVNGGGSTGCMGFMNQGVQDVDGKVTGVIHKMFVKHEEGNENHWAEGCHEVFKTAQKGDDDGKVQLIVASGETLQERKRLLVQDADALVVLPGGEFHGFNASSTFASMYASCILYRIFKKDQEHLMNYGRWPVRNK